MGGSSVQAPQPTIQEMQLQSAQANALKQATQLTTQSYKTQNLLAPYLYQSMGLTPQYGTGKNAGQITGFSQDPAYAALNTKQMNLTNELLDREQAALEGNLPVDPGLTTQLNESEQQLRSEMNANLGPGWETSTPGSTALNQWNTYKSNILESARRGDLTMAEQLALGMQGGQQSGSSFLTTGASGIAGTGANYGGAFAGIAGGYNSPLQLMQNNRALQMQADMFNSQQSNALWAGLGQGVGTLAGIGLGAGLGMGGGSGFLLGGGGGGGSQFGSLIP
jgi:hypothetical protein